MNAGPCYRLHGLTVQSDVPLHTAQVTGRAADLVLARGTTARVPEDLLPGRIIAEAPDTDGSPFYTVTLGHGGLLVRFHGRCDFALSPDHRRITWHPTTDVGEELAGIMASGTVLATVLMLSGHLVLHASAVRPGEAVLAFVGWSGMGKSTLAALLCRGDAQFVTDDVLRVDGDRCYAGANETRLRPTAAPLALGFPAHQPRTTADGRVALVLPAPTMDSMPLGGIIVPHLDREDRPVLAERVRPVEAVLTLSRFPRVQGWRDPDTGRRQFELLGDLAATVPVWRCRIPWGPPHREGLGEEILAAVGW